MIRSFFALILREIHSHSPIIGLEERMCDRENTYFQGINTREFPDIPRNEMEIRYSAPSHPFFRA